MTRVPFWLVVLVGCVLWLAGCGSAAHWNVLELVPHLAGSAPGVLAAILVAARAHGKVKEAEAEAVRAKTIRESDLQAAVLEQLKGYRADLEQARELYDEACARAEQAEERERKSEGRARALNAEIVDLRQLMHEAGYHLPPRRT